MNARTEIYCYATLPINLKGCVWYVGVCFASVVKLASPKNPRRCWRQISLKIVLLKILQKVNTVLFRQYFLHVKVRQWTRVARVIYQTLTLTIYFLIITIYIYIYNSYIYIYIPSFFTFYTSGLQKYWYKH